MLQPYPSVKKDEIDEDVLKAMDWIKSIIVGLRTLRSEMNINPGKVFRVLGKSGSVAAKNEFLAHQSMIEKLAKIQFSSWIDASETPSQCALVTVQDLDLFIPLQDIIDKDSEIKRLEKEIDKLDKDITICQSRLDNPGYVNKAPKAVVDKERERVKEMQEKREKARKSLDELKVQPS